MTRQPPTYRCRGVVWTGVAWMVTGAALFVPAATFFHRQPHVFFGPALLCALVGLFVAFVGIGFATSKITLTDTQLISRWFFSNTHVDWSEAVDVALAPPKSMLRGDGPIPWGAALPGPASLLGSPGDLVTGASLSRLAVLLSWVGFPGSGTDQVLHVITRYRGAVRISPISCRLSSHPGDVVPALSAVQAAIPKPRPRPHVTW